MRYLDFSVISARAARLLGLALAALVLGGVRPVAAFPPAPHHLLHGIVRDSFGNPINVRGTKLILQTPTGTQIAAEIIPGIEPGLNYRLQVPMDSGMTPNLYQPGVLKPAAPFRLWVLIGTTTNLPIEMVADYSHLGQPGETTRMDLTTGVDANHDGLPDDWERLINPDISKVNPNALAPNGMTYLQAYYAGIYSFDITNGLALSLVQVSNQVPTLQFTLVPGRTYTIQTSSDLKNWLPTSFRIPAEGLDAALRSSYLADKVQQLQVEVPSTGSQAALGYYRLMLLQ